MRRCTLAWAALLLVLTAKPAPASGDSLDGAEEEPALEDEFHRNHVGLFVGGITPLTRRHETSFALGVGYERRFLKWLGLEAWTNGVIGDHERGMIFLVGPIFHPVAGLRIITGVGFEVGGEAEHAGARVDPVLAAGVGYDLQAGPILLAPEFYCDFIGRSTTNLTYGLAIGYGFWEELASVCSTSLRMETLENCVPFNACEPNHELMGRPCPNRRNFDCRLQSERQPSATG